MRFGIIKELFGVLEVLSGPKVMPVFVVGLLVFVCFLFCFFFQMSSVGRVHSIPIWLEGGLLNGKWFIDYYFCRL